MRNYVVLVLFGLALLTLALVVRSGIFARKNPGQPINSTMRLAMESAGIPELSEDDERIVRRDFANAHKLPSGLMFVLERAGSGPLPAAGQTVTVNYEGRLLDGTVFDSSYRRKTPFTFHVGTGEVIEGWDEAVLLMRKGSKRTIIVPYWLAYGVNGRPPHIPPRATLVFDIELLDIK
jgi:FKBP-type peptidyl-prolyl cis-trans isomerase